MLEESQGATQPSEAPVSNEVGQGREGGTPNTPTLLLLLAAGAIPQGERFITRHRGAEAVSSSPVEHRANKRKGDTFLGCTDWRRQ